ncbi:MAG: hypothetical protein QGD92_00685 [Gammaproteobacteria bacterium]|nr:hypothetical protein [Gammaproteobacteria bacterium]
MIISLGKVTSPDAEINARIPAWKNSSETHQCIALNYAVDVWWQTVSVELPLAAIYLLSRLAGDSIQILATVTDRVDEFDQCIARDDADFDSVCTSMALPVLNLTAPLSLQTVDIPKPWGREIWHTGSEVRGISTIHGMPLPWVISLNKSGLVGQADAELILLKILDPLPQEVYGDLYFEMHTRKTEVYVVTHIDPTAWPTGKGQMRFGFCAEKLNAYPDPDKFRSAYLNSVQNYQKIRRQIDSRFDEYRKSAGFTEHDPIPVRVLDEWQGRLPDEWQQLEQKLRADMNDFTGIRELSVGDVICIDPFTPHALQHGVRTIEFQTPYYERKILSFAQKVLTQSNWDTETAIQEMTIAAPPQQEFKHVHQSPGILVENIADFGQFAVLRVSIEFECSYRHHLDSYALVICVTGDCDVGGLVLKSEAACLVPHDLETVTIVNPARQPMQCLIAYPNLPVHSDLGNHL